MTWFQSGGKISPAILVIIVILAVCLCGHSANIIEFFFLVNLFYSDYLKMGLGNLLNSGQFIVYFIGDTGGCYFGKGADLNFDRN